MSQTSAASQRTPVSEYEQVDVVVVGGGQAGLAMGHALARRGLRGGKDFVILDAADSVGASWDSRWNSLRLITPTRHTALPGLPFPGPPDAYPGKDDVAAYLRRYATHFDLPVRPATHVQRLTHDPLGQGSCCRRTGERCEPAG